MFEIHSFWIRKILIHTYWSRGECLKILFVFIDASEKNRKCIDDFTLHSITKCCIDLFYNFTAFHNFHSSFELTSNQITKTWLNSMITRGSQWSICRSYGNFSICIEKWQIWNHLYFIYIAWNESTCVLCLLRGSNQIITIKVVKHLLQHTVKLWYFLLIGKNEESIQSINTRECTVYRYIYWISRTSSTRRECRRWAIFSAMNAPIAIMIWMP